VSWEGLDTLFFWIFAFLNVSRIMILSSFCFSPLFASFNITYFFYEDNNISDIFPCLGYFVSFAYIWQELEVLSFYTQPSQLAGRNM
jgi:hypothetical protein